MFILGLAPSPTLDLQVRTLPHLVTSLKHCEEKKLGGGLLKHFVASKIQFVLYMDRPTVILFVTRTLHNDSYST